jgi:DeoR/GlpR family transcriptional regulator of sugar metabolism
VIAVVDATKWGRVGPASFAAVNELSVVITDQLAPHDLVENMRSLGPRIMQV